MNTFLMHDVEMPLIAVIAAMEDNGYGVDVQHFQRLQAQLAPQIAEAKKQIGQVAGAQFNPNSSPQVARLLYKKIGLPIWKLTAKGEPSTDEESLGRLKTKHPVVNHLLRYRGLTKIVSTYCVSIPEHVDGDGRFRATFNQLDAQTGRFASPSVIQTLPKDDEFGIRNGFRASPGHKLVGSDFKQQELAILAQLSGDKNMITAIEGGTDLHGLAAVKVFKLDCGPNDVERLHPVKRGEIKAIQFGLIYGSTAHGLALKIGCKKEQAEQLIADYFRQFPAVQQLIKKVHADVVRDGYVDDVFGRRRYLQAATRTVPRKRWQQMTHQEKRVLRAAEGAKRQAQNFVIQGAAATVTKLAMIRCHQHIAAEHPSIKMILTLHDELHFEVPDDLVNAFASELPRLMCDLGLERFGFKVPFKVDVKVGEAWGSMTKWKGCHDTNQTSS